MDLPDIPLLSMLRQRMTWLNQRQDTLSQNVANVDTPGYLAHDLKPVDFTQELDKANSTITNGGVMRLTDPRHIAVNPSTQDEFESVESHDVESNPDGNTVSLEMEMIKVSDTQAQFQAASNLYAKAMTLMKTAIGH